METKTRKRTLTKYGKPKGRPTDKERIERAIKKANSGELQMSIQKIRLKMVDRLSESSEEVETNRQRAEDVKNLYTLWKYGKEVLADLQREEASVLNTESINKMLNEADSVVDSMGWDDDTTA